MTQYVDTLAKHAGEEWPTIDACTNRAERERTGIGKALDSRSLIPTDCAFIGFGSLARDEATTGSDLDWTLLVDGQTDPQHVRIAQQIDDTLVELKKKKPGPTGVFGGLTFSHDLIRIFFKTKHELTEATPRYGVF